MREHMFCPKCGFWVREAEARHKDRTYVCGVYSLIERTSKEGGHHLYHAVCPMNPREEDFN